ncbi:MAG: hybrid sensor histidine kinase/response regulator [Salinivirgaceae bacterium]|nr:hybrid sensor histidine kinase/response regulator [Salinivirgaceae bacterium]
MTKRKKYSILIVDDTPINLQVLGNTLKNEGYQVEFAISGFDALDWFKKRAFDLVLLDVMMPEMDGFEVCTIIRADKKFDLMPIIFLTANCDTDNVINAFELGAQDYVTKPFNSKELLMRVNTQLDFYDSKKQLIKLNNELEEKVKERTKKLDEANSKLLELDEAKINFLKMISHEIRTPLNGIVGSISLMESENTDKNLIELFEILNISVDRLERFTDIALYITMLEFGHYSLKTEPVNINSLLAEAYSQTKKEYKHKEIKFESNFINSDHTIYGDVKLIGMVLTKLLENAYKYSEDKGTVSVNISRKEERLVVAIKDNGRGLPPEILKYIFTPFSTANIHMNNNIGLDLYFSKLVMDAHQGKIETFNNDNGGATVILSFD